MEAGARYKLRHQYYRMHAAEIPLQAGFTGKERDVKTGYDYGVYPAEGRRRRPKSGSARYYDSRIGRWLSVDPMGVKYANLSLYSYTADNPIILVDPNGSDLSDFYDENGKLVRHVDDKSNAVYRVKGTGVEKHYEFDKFDEKQGGKNVIDLTSAIEEAQNLNMNNPSLKPSNGVTYCNYATQDILATISSILGNSAIHIKGVANDMVAGLQKSPFFTTTGDFDTAFRQQWSGNLVVVGWINTKGPHGHIATLAVGSNLLKGQVANIGKYNGMLPLNGKEGHAFSTIPTSSLKFFILKAK